MSKILLNNTDKFCLPNFLFSRLLHGENAMPLQDICDGHSVQIFLYYL